MTLGDRIAVMKDGVIQQFGSPRELYDSPSTMYVAGFIGSPPMNFIAGELQGVGAGVGIQLDTGLAKTLLKLPFGPEQVRGYVGQTVVLGLRPERITDARAAHGSPAFPAQKVEVRVDVVEPTGPDTLITTHLNGKRVVSRVHPATAPDDTSRLELLLDLSNALLFDPKSGARIDVSSVAHQAA
jgi:multiple sugar transport system ATP-binding protein